MDNVNLHRTAFQCVPHALQTDYIFMRGNNVLRDGNSL